MIYFEQERKKPEKDEIVIPEVSIGLVGHVDHGKTSLTQALTGQWTDTHSEEMKRGITIRLGYADAVFYNCSCGTYGTTNKCVKCFKEVEKKRAVSFIDAPGHETLMATVLSGAALMDGALLLVSANEKCPQPQTSEHLKALDIVGIRNIIIVQNKIDLVTEEEALHNYREIKNFIKGTVAENAPIIPISTVHNANIDILIKAIETNIPTPKRDPKKPAKFYIARSFDVNKPGTPINDLKGGVVGGSLTRGILKSGEEVSISPGVLQDDKWTVLNTKIVGIVQIGPREEAKPGGLVALETELDPSLSRGDALSGAVAGRKNQLSEALSELTVIVDLFEYVVGVEGHQKIPEIKTGDALMVTVAIAKTVGVVTSATKKKITIKLKLPVVAEKGERVAIASQIGGRWHLIGSGLVQ